MLKQCTKTLYSCLLYHSTTEAFSSVHMRTCSESIYALLCASRAPELTDTQIHTHLVLAFTNTVTATSKTGRGSINLQDHFRGPTKHLDLLGRLRAIKRRIRPEPAVESAATSHKQHAVPCMLNRVPQPDRVWRRTRSIGTPSYHGSSFYDYSTDYGHA